MLHARPVGDLAARSCAHIVEELFQLFGRFLAQENIHFSTVEIFTVEEWRAVSTRLDVDGSGCRYYRQKLIKSNEQTRILARKIGQIIRDEFADDSALRPFRTKCDRQSGELRDVSPNAIVQNRAHLNIIREV